MGVFASYIQDSRIAAQYTLPKMLDRMTWPKEETELYRYGKKYNEYMPLTRITC